MKTDKEIKIRDIAGERVAVRQGSYGTDMTKIVAFNPVAEWLWEQLTDKEFTKNDITNLLKDGFDLDKQTATRDAEAWVNQCLEVGIIKD